VQAVEDRLALDPGLGRAHAGSAATTTMSPRLHEFR
jgi:hypothetical protein